MEMWNTQTFQEHFTDNNSSGGGERWRAIRKQGMQIQILTLQITCSAGDSNIVLVTFVESRVAARSI